MYPVFGLILPLGLMFGVFLFVASLLLLPALFVYVMYLLYKRTKGQQPSKVVTIPGLKTQVDLGIFTGLIEAAQAHDQAKMMKEIEMLAFRAGEVGGIEALLENFVYTQLERKLATPGKRTLALSATAKALGVSERELLNLLEGKNAVTNTPAPTSSSVIPIAAPLMALAFFLFAAGDSQAAGPLKNPQRFYPTEVEPVIDPPTFRTPVKHDLAGPQRGQQLTAPQGTQYYQPINYGGYSSGRRWFRCR